MCHKVCPLSMSQLGRDAIEARRFGIPEIEAMRCHSRFKWGAPRRGRGSLTSPRKFYLASSRLGSLASLQLGYLGSSWPSVKGQKPEHWSCKYSVRPSTPHTLIFSEIFPTSRVTGR